MNAAHRAQCADLTGRVALVTGARIGIGEAVALRLLRNGAHVIAVTRFPVTAARHYTQHADFQDWRDRLHVYGLDLKQVLRIEQFAQHVTQTYPRLDILINNAAQTVRYSAMHYEPLYQVERTPFVCLEPQVQELLHCDLNWRVRLPSQISPIEGQQRLQGQGYRSERKDAVDGAPDIDEAHRLAPSGNGDVLDAAGINSWRMQDDDVSALELVEVHIVNAVAPFLLCSRLKRFMATAPNEPQEDKPGRYIINVSSMEGRFSHKKKPSRHPHTNMAKAALNMLTKTCEREYARLGIYMNSVDPGWISFQQPLAQQEHMRAHGIVPPFDVVDAAARICHPVYAGINSCHNAHGKLFKDYAETTW